MYITVIFKRKIIKGLEIFDEEQVPCLKKLIINVDKFINL
jgi:hypothetical protein